MVARSEHSGDAAPARPRVRPASALFLTWRRVLTVVLVTTPLRAGRSLARLVRPVVRVFARAGRAVRTGAERTFSAVFLRWRLWLTRIGAPSARRRVRARAAAALPAVGVTALAAGSLLALGLARPLGTPLAEAAVAVAWSLGWAGLRLGVMRAAMPEVPGRAVHRSWAIGLIPSAGALTDVLRLVALAASGWLTWRALLREDVDRSDARRGVSWAFGAEFAAGLARVVASAVLLYLIARAG